MACASKEIDKDALQINKARRSTYKGVTYNKFIVPMLGRMLLCDKS